MDTSSHNFGWFPGHIKQAAEELREHWYPLLDGIIELRDARVPLTCAQAGTIDKPVVVIYTKADRVMEDPEAARRGEMLIKTYQPHRWRRQVLRHLETGTQEVRDKLLSQGRKRRLRFGVCGLPNVGKSTFLYAFINKHAQTADTPGTTRSLRFASGDHIDLLDTPGILLPKISRQQAIRLSICNLLPEKLFDWEEMADMLSLCFWERGWPVPTGLSPQETVRAYRARRLAKIGLEAFP